MSEKRLNPIYAALEAHQYGRTIKLCLSAIAAMDNHNSQTTNNAVLVKALLANAYSKNGQSEKAVAVLHVLLNSTNSIKNDGDDQQQPTCLFPELAFRFQQLGVRADASSAVVGGCGGTSSSTTTAVADATRGRKGRKKGKGGGNNSNKNIYNSATTTMATPHTAVQDDDVDVVQLLDATIHSIQSFDHWDTTFLKDRSKITTSTSLLPIDDMTTLETLCLTLQALRLPLTAFQMYLVCVSERSQEQPSVEPDVLVRMGRKVFDTGLHVLCNSSAASSTFPTLSSSVLTILSHLQVTALQLARWNAVDTSWAAQCCLWQLELIEKGVEKHAVTMDASYSGVAQQQLRLQMLPRLAESMSGKLVLGEPSNNNNNMPAHEHVELHSRILQQQRKYDDMVEFWEIVGGTMGTNNEKEHQRRLAEIHQKQRHDYAKAEVIYRRLLLRHSNEDDDPWMHWKELIECAKQQGGVERARSVCECVRTEQQETSSSERRPLRAHALLRCELAALSLYDDNHRSSTTELYEAIIEYAELCAPRAACAFSDIEPYVKLVCVSPHGDCDDDAHVRLRLGEWAQGQLVASVVNLDEATSDRSDRSRAKLRMYIFASKVLCCMVASAHDSQLLPDWKKLVQEWMVWQELSDRASETVVKDTPTQKENQPSDEIILVAVQALLYNSSDREQLLAATILLEMALNQSPHNAYLKITAIGVYAQLCGSGRMWELVQSLGIKHIQFDSCSYLAIPCLQETGMYNELVTFSNSVLNFHAKTEQNSDRYCAHAMELGSLSKVDEILVFQRDRMNCSLALLDAKSHIMDCAPILSMGQRKVDSLLGLRHGIVGDESDVERVTDFVKESHNPFGAPNLTVVVSQSPTCDSFSDNRDLSVLDYQILFRTTPVVSKENVFQDALRSGHIHGLLLRAALCLDVAKGPKKGKLVKSSSVLITRCTSLLQAVSNACIFADEVRDDSQREILRAMTLLCRTMVLVCSGLTEPSLQSNNRIEDDDTLDTRDKHAGALLQSSLACLQTSSVSSSTVSCVCRNLPTCYVPLLVLIRMTAKALALFGWGRRRVTSKASAGALARLASHIKEWIVDAKQIVSHLPTSDDERHIQITQNLAMMRKLWNETSVLELTDESMHQAVCERVAIGQQTTRDRVEPFLDEILEDLGTFEVTEMS